MIGTSETIRWTLSLFAMKRILVAVVAAVVVTIAEIIEFNANVRVFTFEVIGWTSKIDVLAIGGAFVRRLVVLTVVHTIANLAHGNTSMIGACEFPFSTFWIIAILFIT